MPKFVNNAPGGSHARFPPVEADMHLCPSIQHVNSLRRQPLSRGTDWTRGMEDFVGGSRARKWNVPLAGAGAPRAMLGRRVSEGRQAIIVVQNAGQSRHRGRRLLWPFGTLRSVTGCRGRFRRSRFGPVPQVVAAGRTGIDRRQPKDGREDEKSQTPVRTASHYASIRCRPTDKFTSFLRTASG